MSSRVVAVVLVAIAALAAALLLLRRANGITVDVPWFQAQITPGPLSRAHAFLQRDCATCHTPTQGADASKCIGCHANETALLQRQPTAFHATIGACARCHVEHRVVGPRPVAMDHAQLAAIGLDIIRRRRDPTSARLLAWMRQHEAGTESVSTHPEVTTREAALSCMACHSTKDVHQGYFGGDCASCHRTAAWTIPAFRHPSARSVECVQCHQPPPSHRMMHFTMVSRRVARAPDARVDQCFLCHQTTSWNDIQRAGWYKHH